MPINSIGYPQKHSEFEIHAEVYLRLKNQGVRVRGEVLAWVDDDGPHRCRLDLVVFDSVFSAVAIIECKNYDDPGNRTVIFGRNNRQGRRYHSFGIPVFQCVCWAQIDLTVSAVMELLGEIAQV